MTRLQRALFHGAIAFVAVRALATQDPALTNSVFGPWGSVFSEVDLVTMLCIAVVAFWMTRSFKFSETTAILVPTSLGLVYGLIEAATRLEAGAGWAIAAQTLFAGVMLNGAAATLTGRLIGFLMERWYPSPAGQYRKAVDDTAKAIQRGETPPPPGVVVNPPPPPTLPPTPPPDKLEPPG